MDTYIRKTDTFSWGKCNTSPYELLVSFYALWLWYLFYRVRAHCSCCELIGIHIRKATVSFWGKCKRLLCMRFIREFFVYLRLLSLCGFEVFCSHCSYCRMSCEYIQK